MYTGISIMEKKPLKKVEIFLKFKNINVYSRFKKLIKYFIYLDLMECNICNIKKWVLIEY